MLAILPRGPASYSYAGTTYANPHAVTSIGGTTYTYDNNGNVTAIGSLDYTWDWRNRLSSAERSGGASPRTAMITRASACSKRRGVRQPDIPTDTQRRLERGVAATTTKHIFLRMGRSWQRW